MKSLLIALFASCIGVFAPQLVAADTASTVASKPSRVLFILTSHAQLGDTGRATGYYLSELTHPYHVFAQRGFEIDIVSVKGGKPPVDGFDLSDPINRAFWDNPQTRSLVENTRPVAEANADDYDAVFVSGGHGTMWDLPDNTAIARVLARVYERGGVVAAVCHGPAALVNVKLSNGRYLVDGKRVAAFTNDEERAVKLDRVVPFLLADKLEARGAKHEPAPNFTEKVVVSERLVTGQNPASATATGEAVAKLLQKK